MKKFVYYFLIVCIVLKVQFYWDDIVNAKPIKEINDNLISPVEGDKEIFSLMLVKL